MNIRELDLTVDTLDGGTELINEDLGILLGRLWQDHPGFQDPAYRERQARDVRRAQKEALGDRVSGEVLQARRKAAQSKAEG